MAGNVPDEALARYITQMGAVTAEQVEAARAIQAEKASRGVQASLGDVLVEQGLLAPATRENIERKLQSQQPGGVRQLGNYKLIKKLGEGGMGAVYLAEDTMLARQVALKVLPKKFTESPEFLARFSREAKAAGKLNHPNIVGAYAVGEEQGHHYYVMEYCEGETLEAPLKRQKCLAETQVLDVAIQVVQGLKYAHEHGIIHRDIKPANIFLTRDGVAKVLDLGLSKNVAEGEKSFQTVSGTALGTPHYISPEQAQAAKDIDGRTDMYSLGATMYHLLTGETPFHASTAAAVLLKHITAQLPDPRDIRPELSEGVVHIVTKAMAKSPADRYAHMGEMLEDLERVKAGEAPSSAMLDAAHSSIAMRAPSPRAGEGRDERAARVRGEGAAARAAPGVRRTGGQQPAVPRGARAPVSGPASDEAAAAPGKRPLGLYLGVGGGAVVLFGLVLAFALRGGPEPEKPRADRTGAPAGTADKGETTKAPPPGPTAITKPPEAPKSLEEAASAAFDKLSRFEGLAADDTARRIESVEAFLKEYRTTIPGARAQVLLEELRKGPAQTPPPVVQPAVVQPAVVSTEGLPKDLSLDLGGGVKVEMVLIPAGTFTMGSPAGEPGREADGREGPQHAVTITKPFYIGKYEVTVAQFRRFAESAKYVTWCEKDGNRGYGWDNRWQELTGVNWKTPNYPQSDNHPVVLISWLDAQAFASWASKATARTVRLPTEAEWEYACRAGTTTRFSPGQEDKDLDKACWGVGNSERKPHPVGEKAPNAWGLYDMHGNMWEWCADWYENYGPGASVDPQGPAQGGNRVFRGGSWSDLATGCRSAHRGSGAPVVRATHYGFRLVVDASLGGAPLVPPAPAAVDAPERWKNAVDLLGLVDLGKDVAQGQWTRQAAGLRPDPTNRGLLEFPYRPPAEYDIRIVFSRDEGLLDAGLVLSKGGRSFKWQMWYKPEETQCGFEMVKGQWAATAANPTVRVLKPPIENGRRYVSIVQVRNDGLKAYLDGKPVSEWKTDYSDMAIFQNARLRDETILGLTTLAAKGTVHEAQVLEVSGRGTFTRPDDPAAKDAERKRSAAAVQPAAAAPAAEEWTSLFDGRTLAGWSVERHAAASDVKVSDGAIECTGSSFAHRPLQGRDVIVQAKVRSLKGGSHQMNLWTSRELGQDGYGAVVGDDSSVSIGQMVNKSFALLRTAQVRLPADGFFELTFAAVGDALTIQVDGQETVRVRRDTLTEFQRLSLAEWGGGAAYFKDVRAKVLDAAAPKTGAEQPAAGIAPAPTVSAATAWPFDAAEAARRQDAAAKALGIAKAASLDLGGGVKLPIVLIPSGTFIMGATPQDVPKPPAGGSQPQERGLNLADEAPPHQVTLSRAFYVAATEVTQGQYEAIVGGNPSKVKSAAMPADGVSWDDAAEFCRKLSAKLGRVVRLPTEAEWEFACRAGAATAYCCGNDAAKLGEYAWFNAGPDKGPQETWSAYPVGQKKPNAFGLYDMHGNVVEWCQDRFGPYDAAAATDPQGAAAGAQRAIRGGNAGNQWWGVRSTCRFGRPANTSLAGRGFRVALDASALPKELSLDLGGGAKMELVLVPAGEFMMGDDGPEAANNEKPAHKVRFSKPYYIGKHEVTVAQFARFAGTTGYQTDCEKAGDRGTTAVPVWGEKAGINWKKPGFAQGPNHPVVLVSWNDADAFCKWASTAAQVSGLRPRPGGLRCTVRIPTEAEWEYASRGPDGRKYPWGDTWDGTRANHGDVSFKKASQTQGATTNDNDGFAYTAPVGSYKLDASWCGAHDLAGNVTEWCADWFSAAYYAQSPAADPNGPAAGVKRVSRPGCWFDGTPATACRSARRLGHMSPDGRHTGVGFRVVLEAPAQAP